MRDNNIDECVGGYGDGKDAVKIYIYIIQITAIGIVNNNHENINTIKNACYCMNLNRNLVIQKVPIK